MGNPEIDGTQMEPGAWLSHEDAVCREDRVARIRWLAKVYPPIEIALFPGGLISKLLFEEMRHSFVYGQFLAVIMLGMAYMEQTLGALFYGGGRDDLERAGIRELLREAERVGMLAKGEVDELERIRQVRNPVAHFRRPMAGDSIDFRSVQEEANPYILLGKDAQIVIGASMRILAKSGR